MFKVGDKVKIPKVKPLSHYSLEDCILIKKLPKGQDFAYISSITDDIILGAAPGQKHSRFDKKDIELYNEEPNYEIY